MAGTNVDFKGLTAPKWDGKDDSAPMYLEKLEALAEVFGIGDALDESEAVNLPSKAQYEAFTDTTDPNSKLRNLYTANRRLSAIFTLGQESNHGLAALRKTKVLGFPHGKVYLAIKQIKTKCQPSDLTAEVELKAELDRVKFHFAVDYYKAFVDILAKYDVTISETDQVMLLVTKCNSQTFSKMIMDHLSDTSVPNSLETICTEIGKIQRLAKAGSGGGQRGGEKEVHLASTDGYRFPGVCSHCGKKAGHKRADCPDRKAGKPKAGSGAPGGGGNNNGKTCNFCGGKGHVEEGCWKKHPDLAPDWLKKKLASAEASGSSVEIMMSSIECGFENAAAAAAALLSPRPDMLPSVLALANAEAGSTPAEDQDFVNACK